MKRNVSFAMLFEFVVSCDNLFHCTSESLCVHPVHRFL